MYTNKDKQMLKKGGFVVLGILVVFAGLVSYQLYSNHQESIKQEDAEAQQTAASNHDDGKAEIDDIADIADIAANPAPGYIVTAPEKNNQVTVTEDKDGNQTITPKYEKPEPPKGNPVDDHESEPVPTPNKPNPKEDKTEDKDSTDKTPETPKTPDKPTEPDAPKSGDVKDGKTYVSGFGWVEGTGDTNVKKVDGDGDINKMVGIM